MIGRAETMIHETILHGLNKCLVSEMQGMHWATAQDTTRNAFLSPYRLLLL